MEEPNLTNQTGAENEHIREVLPFKTTEKELGQRYGFGYEFYFIFVRFLGVFNLVLGLVGFIGFGPRLSSTTDGLQTLFFTSFPLEIRDYWKSSSILQTILFFSSGMCYFLFVRIKTRKRVLAHENAFVVDIIAAEQIQGNNKYGFWTRWFFRSISYTILFGLTALSIYVTFLLQNVYTEGKSTNISFINFVLVIFINLSGTIFMTICKQLTVLEKHRSHSGYKLSHILKIYFFKVAIVLGLNLTTGVKNFCQGGFNSMLLLLLDLVVWNFVELVSPVVMAKLFKLLKITSNKSDEEQKPVFDLAEEFIELFYRQYIVFSAVTIFPIVGLFAFVVTCCEYPLDKFKLLKMCQQPKRINNNLTIFIVLLLSCTAITSLFSPYSILNLNRPYYNRDLINSNNECKVTMCYFNRDDCQVFE